MLGWAFKNEGSNDIRSMAIPKAQASKVNTMFRWVELSKSRTKVHNLLGWVLETHSTCNVLLGWAFGNTIVPYLSFLQNLKRQYMPIFAAMGRLTHRNFDVLLSWAFETTTVHTYLSSGVSKDTQSYTLFAENMTRVSLFCILCVASGCALCSAFEITFEITHSACFSLIGKLCTTTLSPQARYANLVILYIYIYRRI